MIDTDSNIDQKYLLDNNLNSERDKYKKNVLDKDLASAVDHLKKYMTITGILTADTMPLIDIVVEKIA